MIHGIGIDCVDIQRFTHWSKYSKKQLLRILSEQEITYCLQEPALSAQRFAGRFSLKEAAFKAWSTATGEKTSFLTWCKQIETSVPGKIALAGKHSFTIWSSLSHTPTLCTAIVIFEKQ